MTEGSRKIGPPLHDMTMWWYPVDLFSCFQPVSACIILFKFIDLVLICIGINIYQVSLQPKQARKPRSYASLKLRLTDWLTYLLTDEGKV